MWFRESCRQQALSAGVAGWVRNHPDGTVEAVLEGEPGAVERLVAWMREGPRLARVTRVEVSVEAPAGERGFHVR